MLIQTRQLLTCLGTMVTRKPGLKLGTNRCFTQNMEYRTDWPKQI